MTWGDMRSGDAVPGAKIFIPVTPGPTVAMSATGDAFSIWTAGQNTTINFNGPQKPGQTLTLFIANDSLLPRVITFGTGFKASGTFTGLLGKTGLFKFDSNGTYFYQNPPTFL